MTHTPDHKTQPLYASGGHRLPLDWCPTCHKAVESAEAREARLCRQRGPKRPKIATVASNLELWTKGEHFCTQTLLLWLKRGLISKTNGRLWVDAQLTPMGSALILALEEWRKKQAAWKIQRMGEK